jgi:nicotinamidase-related amidase
MTELTLDPATTALVLIDLQRGIATGQTAPNAAADVVARGARSVRGQTPKESHGRRA